MIRNYVWALKETFHSTCNFSREALYSIFLHNRTKLQSLLVIFTMAAMMSGTFASPAANANYSPPLPIDNGVLSGVYAGVNNWSVALTILLVFVAYDQCKFKIV